MLIVMHHSATDKDIEKVKKTISSMGLRPVAIPGAERTAIGVIGNQGWIDDSPVRVLKNVLEIIHVTKPYKLVSRDFHPSDTVVTLGRNIKVGGKSPLLIIAGPCAVESREQMFKTADFLKKLGVPVLRGGAYKPRTSPYSFQGMRKQGLDLLDEVRKEVGILVVTEVMSPEQVDMVAEKVDILQIGARNMQNYDLLKEVGRIRKPVILKRGLSATVEEWLASAEYILKEGNPEVVLCERGIRTFETATRNTADLSITPLLKAVSHLPIIFDPSHATGHRHLVSPMAMASVVTGVDGIMVEVHPDPEHALSDGPQSLHFKEFEKLYGQIKELEDFMKRLIKKY
ncbi:MAG: 3-deoxy-7-phosphoheptulonate synthase [Nitrospira bacterium HGW-Nitrospira-1]|nr:MAG: 3-deoxy-7-phosphoheptulonate synthase [Nitrospira bacterium HGW-Nitrospira-1]